MGNCVTNSLAIVAFQDIEGVLVDGAVDELRRRVPDDNDEAGPGNVRDYL